MILTSIGVFCRKDQDVCVVVTKCLCMFDSRNHVVVMLVFS